MPGDHRTLVRSALVKEQRGALLIQHLRSDRRFAASLQRLRRRWRTVVADLSAQGNLYIRPEGPPEPRRVPEYLDFALRPPTQVCEDAIDRDRVRQYIAAVERFCKRWHLDSPDRWAFNRLVHSHFTHLRAGGAYEVLPFPLSDVFAPSRVRFIVRIPGRSDEDFERDARELGSIYTLRHEGNRVTVSLPITRQEMARLERDRDSAALIYDWRGSPSNPIELRRSRQASTPSIMDAVAARLGRGLTEREKRALRRDARPQWVATLAAQSNRGGWSRRRYADEGLHARWLARRLLGETCSTIAVAAGGTCKFPSTYIQRETTAYARALGLTIPRRVD